MRKAGAVLACPAPGGVQSRALVGFREDVGLLTFWHCLLSVWRPPQPSPALSAYAPPAPGPPAALAAAPTTQEKQRVNTRAPQAIRNIRVPV